MNCPECKSEDIRKAGLMLTRKGKQQRYQCKQCGRMFQVLPNV